MQIIIELFHRMIQNGPPIALIYDERNLLMLIWTRVWSVVWIHHQFFFSLSLFNCCLLLLLFAASYRDRLSAHQSPFQPSAWNENGESKNEEFRSNTPAAYPIAHIMIVLHSNAKFNFIQRVRTKRTRVVKRYFSTFSRSTYHIPVGKSPLISHQIKIE